MPEFSKEFRNDYYQVEFMEDGYPGRRQDGALWAHPLYGVYVLDDYLRQYEKEPNNDLRSAIKSVAYAAVDRMEEHKGTLVFWYDAAPERGARLYKRHYSGLTQAQYAVVLHRAGESLDDDGLVEVAALVFESLMIPVEDGGVYHDTERGPVIAEVPQKPNSWILNGWQTALLYMQKYGELAGSERARRVVQASAETMADVLPLYDLPDLANSRYGLSGYTYMRLNLVGSPPGVAVEDVRLDVPGEGGFEVPVREGTRWQNYLFTEDVEKSGEVKSGSVRMNVVFSLASHPDPNALHFTVNADGPVDVAVEAQVGEYDPLESAPVNKRWEEISRVSAEPGEDVTVRVPEAVVGGAAYPTNFVKKIEGKHVNVYHPLHVERLRALAEFTGVERLAEWGSRWEDYICEWSKMELYEGLYAPDHSEDGAIRSPAAFC